MKKPILIIALVAGILSLGGCSVFGNSGVEIAPYEVLEKDGAYELRHYKSLVLVTTPMQDLDEDSNPFYKLFNYISGENKAEQEFAMTAPVFMDQLDGKTETMSFVLPKDFKIADAPAPSDADVKLKEIKDYTVATITFSGSLNRKNIDANQVLLEAWVEKKGYDVTGAAKAAGYNPPFTIPAFRRNEVLIPVKAQ